MKNLLDIEIQKLQSAQSDLYELGKQVEATKEKVARSQGTVMTLRQLIEEEKSNENANEG